MTGLTCIKGRLYTPIDVDEAVYLEHGAMLVDEAGRITAVGEAATLQTHRDVAETIDYGEDLILPGFVDTHIHLPQLPIRGKSGNTLLEWLTRYAFPVEERFAETAYARSLSEMFFRLLAENGTTTALVFSSVHEASTHVAFEAAESAGLRILMGKVMMDQNVPESMRETVADSLDASQRLAARWHNANNGLLRYALTPRFALSCSKELLTETGRLLAAQPDLYLQSHLSENLDEVASVRRAWPEADHYTGVYEKTGCLGRHSVMAHGIHLEPRERLLLAATGTAVSHCPTSNFFLKSGFFNLNAMQDAGIRLGLGTDVGAGPDISMLRVMRAMDDVQLAHQRYVSPRESLYYATLGGARALSLEAETGSLQPGRSADYVVIRLDTLNPLEGRTQALDDTLSQLVYLGDSQVIRETRVRGRRVTQGQPQTCLV